MSSLRPATIVPDGNSTSLAGYWGQVYSDAIHDKVPVPIPVTDKTGGTFQVPYYLADPKIPIPPQYSFGQSLNAAWTAAPGTDEAEVGKTYRVTYDLAFPAFQDWQAKALETKWRADDRVKVHYVALYPEQRKVIVEFTMQKPSSPALIIAGALAAAVVGISLFLTVRSLEKLVTKAVSVDTPVGQFSLGGVILLGIVGIFLLPMLKR